MDTQNRGGDELRSFHTILRINGMMDFEELLAGSLQDLKSPSRKAEYVGARDDVITWLYDNTDMTLVEIGRVVDRHCSTVNRALKRKGRR